jgi:mannose-6-phosphate isomerase-like protein (cupin superfamily)
MAATYRLSPHQTLTVTKSSADTGGALLELEATWTGGGSLPRAHFHPAQSEHFEVVDGGLRVLLDGEERVLGPGDVIEVPPGTVHAMTATEQGARAIWQIRPALRTQEMFAALSEAHRRGGSLLDFVPVARAHSAEIRFTKPPPLVQGPLFAAIALVARLLRR